MRLISTKVCKTSDIGVNENLFGGTMLAWLDESAAIMSCDLANTQRMVTLKIDEVLFKEPVKVSDHIRIYGKVFDIGNSSLTLKLEARRRNFDFEILETVVCSTYIIFVQVDEEGKSLKFSDSIKAKINDEK